MIESMAERVRAGRSLSLLVGHDLADLLAIEVDRHRAQAELQARELLLELVDGGLKDLRGVTLGLGQLGVADCEVAVRLAELRQFREELRDELVLALLVAEERVGDEGAEEFRV